jgi:hypothetical protein
MTTLTTAQRMELRRQKTADKKAGNSSTYRFKQKSTTIRILPSWRPETHEDPTFFHDFGQTWIKDLDGKVLAVVGDNKMTFGEECPVRDLVERAYAGAKTDAQRNHYKEMKAKPRVLVNALILDDKEVKDNEPQIVEFSETQFDTILKDMLAAEKAGDDVLSLTDGFDITVDKSGSGLETKYAFTLARRSSAVKGDPMASINDIDAFIRAQFADNAKAINAIKAVSQGESLALTDRSTDMNQTRANRTTEDTVVDAEYSIVDDANTGGTDTVVKSVHVSDAEIDALFD